MNPSLFSAGKSGKDRRGCHQKACRRQAIFLVVVLTIFLAGGCTAKQQQPADGKGGQESAVPVSTARAKMGVLEATSVISGKLEAGQSANVVAKVPGKVAAVHVDVGSAVRAGQVLVALENTDLAARLEQAKAGVKQAAAALAQAQANLKSAQANLENSRENYRIAEASYNRAKELLVAGAIPQAEFESRYELPYKQARQAAEVIGPAQVELAQAQLSSAQAVLENAQAQLTLAKTAYEDSLIRAPISGLVTARNVNPGEMATNMAPVISLANLDKVEVRATVGESLVNQLKQGQRVQVKISAVSDKPFTGVVTNIAPTADPVSKGFPIKIQIDNPKHVLKPGMFAEVRLTPPQKEALLVPREAVIKAEDKNVVWVIKEGQAQKKEVQVGESDGRQIVITAGLTEGEEVVVAGQENLQEGVKVEVVK